MVQPLIIVIYLSFISLGLPDSMLGSAWPLMHQSLHVSVASAGIISIIITAGTIVSSLMSNWLTSRLAPGKVTAISVCLTAVALFGFSISPSLVVLCFFAIPYGLGAGAVDAALNNYVALHYSSRHMSWLHCMWGIGASVGPFIMGLATTGNLQWQGGYRIVSIIQAVIAVIIIVSLPLWAKGRVQKTVEQSLQSEQSPEIEQSSERVTLTSAIRLPGASAMLLVFLLYCGIEGTGELWAGSYFSMGRGVSATTVAMWATMFPIGITVGRAVSGFIAGKLKDSVLVIAGSAIILVGVVVIAIPFTPSWVGLVGVMIAGLGCAPIYPSAIHMTPERFGEKNSQAMIGLQMACAYVGSLAIPPLYGLVGSGKPLLFFPLFMGVMAVIMAVIFLRLTHRAPADLVR
jgi:fucose permease